MKYCNLYFWWQAYCCIQNVLARLLMAHWRAVTVIAWYDARAFGSQQQAFEHHENVSVLYKEELDAR